MKNKNLFIFAGLTMLVHGAVSAVDTSMQIQILDAEIEQLTAEKQKKYGELEKCEKSVNGFKIAGITTLGLTAVGAGVNIYQVSKRNKLDDQIELKKKEVANAKTAAEKLKAEQDILDLEKQKATDEKQDLENKTKCDQELEKLADKNDKECVKQEDNSWVIRRKSKQVVVTTNKSLTKDQTQKYNQVIALGKSILNSEACVKAKISECENVSRAVSVIEKNITTNTWDDKIIVDLKNKIDSVTTSYAQKKQTVLADDKIKSYVPKKSEPDYDVDSEYGKCVAGIDMDWQSDAGLIYMNYPGVLSAEQSKKYVANANKILDCAGKSKKKGDFQKTISTSETVKIGDKCDKPDGDIISESADGYLVCRAGKVVIEKNVVSNDRNDKFIIDSKINNTDSDIIVSAQKKQTVLRDDTIKKVPAKNQEK